MNFMDSSALPPEPSISVDVVIGERFFRVRSFEGMKREKFRAFVAACKRERPDHSAESSVVERFLVDVMTFFAEATGAPDSDVENGYRADLQPITKMLGAMLTVCDLGWDGGFDFNELPSSRSELPN